MISPNLGVCYYPEHWPEDMWENDAKDMRDMGLTWVRIAEFAWSQIEPKPGVFNWEWLDRAVNVLGAQGLQVILGTPTATPPRWMIEKHPDMLAVDKDGHPRKFGSRRHYCFSHKGYREESVRITAAMAKRYGQNPYVKAWQTDNEYGCHDTILSYSQPAEAAFRIWLKDKYQTIERLNEAWGNVFWSMEYFSFDDIDLPNLTVTEPNPAHVMDFHRFSSDQVVAFNKAQCDALRQHSNAPLIHNYMGRITEFDHFDVGADLDIASWDSYPLGFLEDRSDQGEAFKHDYMRQGDPDFQAFHHDIYRAVGQGRWWVMEQQPGPVNWAPYNPAPLPGMVRLWTWEAVAHGAEAVCYFRWRQAPFAQEQMHAGLMRPDGAPALAAPEIKTVARELDELPHHDIQPAKIGLVFDYASAWAWDTQPQGRDFDYFRLVYDTYRGLRRLGLSIDILPPTTSNFGDRQLICIPGLFAWTDELSTAMAQFSGHVLVGPRTGSKTHDFKIPQVLPPEVPGLSCKVIAVETLRPSAPIPLKGGGAFHIWREFVDTTATLRETCEDGYPALISNVRTHYVTGWPNDKAMDHILGSLAKEAGLNTMPLKGGHRCRDFGSYRLHMNYGPKSMKIGGKDIAAGDVFLEKLN